MCRLKGASLLEAIIAAIIFLLVFMTAMELIPRLTVHNDDAALMAEANCRAMATFGQYACGTYPYGEYTEQYNWGRVLTRVTPYRELPDMQFVEVTAYINGNWKQISIKQIVECSNVQNMQ